MIHLVLAVSLAAAHVAAAGRMDSPRPDPDDVDAETIASVADSGRCSTVAESPSERVAPRMRVTPGLPPLLSFRYL